MNYKNDTRTVITLDAGGTNFVFGAICSGEYVIEPITLASQAEDLDACLGNLVKGFSMVIDQLENKPVAISFAFPGPADYPNGIIGGYLPNFPSFRQGVALGAFLESQFGIPVFINNDADLYVYGEAIAGVLAEVNEKLTRAGSAKQYKNLIGYTFGTGFGFGFAVDGKLHIGDNSCTETFCLKHKLYPNCLVEDGVSVRAIKRVYGELSGDTAHALEPRDIYEIAEGTRAGDRAAALGAFEQMGETAGDAIATAASLIDGLIVIGGGLVGAHKYIFPAILREMRSQISTLGGDMLSRIQPKVYDLDDEQEFTAFSRGQSRQLKVYGTDKTVIYDPEKRIGITYSKIGASRAIALGAYAFALNEIDSGKALH